LRVIDMLMAVPMLLGIDWMDPEWLLDRFGDQMFWVSVAIVFIECGLLFPILPGDSLLFSVGLFVHRAQAGEAGIDVGIVAACAILSLAAFLGNVVGYEIGRAIGEPLQEHTGRFIKKKYFDQTHEFFEKYGNRAIVLARFVPIVRTFVPFVAGAGTMTYSAFAFYNVSGAVIWVGICTIAGFAFGNVPIVKNNFTLVALGIIAVSLLPMVVEIVRHRRAA
jgi:membrane-associated protein